MADGTINHHPLRTVSLEITVSVGRARPKIRDLLSMQENDILPLDRKMNDPVELYVGERLIAKGELQLLGEPESGQLAVRLTEVISTVGDAN